MIPISWDIFGPAIVLAGGALVALVADLLTTKRSFVLSWLPMLAASVAALTLDVWSAGLPFGFDGVILIGTTLIVLASAVLHTENAMPPGEFQFLVGSAAAGGLVIVGAVDLVTLLVGLELLTLPSIALVGLRQADRRAIGAAWTFFLTSVVATAITLMGIALLYGITGSLRYGFMGSDIVGSAKAAVTVGILLTVTGFLFKIGTVPFHAWVPDAYRSASPVVAGFLASVSKAATLGALLVLLYLGLPAQHASIWQPVVAIVAALSMTVGNLGALRQRDGVAVLAWSSIAQAGFLLAPAVGPDFVVSTNAAAQYLAVYALANIVAFVALAVVLKVRGSTSYEELAGLARTDPWVGVPLAFAVLTLAGFPPAVIGLVTKYVVFVPVVQDGPLWLAIVMAVNVMLGLAYYLKLVATLFAPADSTPFRSVAGSAGVRLAVLVVTLGALGLVAASVWPSGVLDHVLPVTIDPN
ncbi:MAG TPA: proton-conducting transporter membrane subunit [Aeromicrobium sp.]|nr:proton-conducting transporter membrane subunit [Aeromicrobium sp.]